MRRYLTIIGIIFSLFFIKSGKADPFGIYPTSKALSLAGNLVAHGLGEDALFENPAGLVYPYPIGKKRIIGLGLSEFLANTTETETNLGFFLSGLLITPSKYGIGLYTILHNSSIDNYENTNVNEFGIGFGVNLFNSKFLRFSIGGRYGIGYELRDPNYYEETRIQYNTYAVGIRLHLLGKRKINFDIGFV
ncbi:MAG: hypothetical protein ABGX27_07105, partial [Desulfurobacteriaceae bacterium]